MREIFIAISVVGIFSAEAIDKITGPIRLNPRLPLYQIHNELLASYPFSSVAVILRTTGLWLLLVLLAALIKNKFFPKAAAFCVLGFMSILFAIQQLYTNYQSMTYQWTVSVLYTGIALCITGFIFIGLGMIHAVVGKVEGKPAKPIPQVTVKKVTPTADPS